MKERDRLFLMTDRQRARLATSQKLRRQQQKKAPKSPPETNQQKVQPTGPDEPEKTFRLRQHGGNDYYANTIASYVSIAIGVVGFGIHVLTGSFRAGFISYFLVAMCLVLILVGLWLVRRYQPALMALRQWEGSAIRAVEWWRHRKDADPEGLEEDDIDDIRAHLDEVLTEAQNTEANYAIQARHPYNSAEGRMNMAEYVMRNRRDKVQGPWGARRPFRDGGNATWEELAEIFEDYHEWRKWRFRTAKKIANENKLIAAGEKPKAPPLPSTDMAYEALHWYEDEHEHLQDRKAWEQSVLASGGLWSYERYGKAVDRARRHPLRNEATLERFARMVLRADPSILGRSAASSTGLETQTVQRLCLILKTWRDDEVKRYRFLKQSRDQDRIKGHSTADPKEDAWDRYTAMLKEIETRCLAGYEADLAREQDQSEVFRRWDGKYTREVNRLDGEARDSADGVVLDIRDFKDIIRGATHAGT